MEGEERLYGGIRRLYEIYEQYVAARHADVENKFLYYSIILKWLVEIKKKNIFLIAASTDTILFRGFNTFA